MQSLHLQQPGAPTQPCGGLPIVWVQTGSSRKKELQPEFRHLISRLCKWDVAAAPCPGGRQVAATIYYVWRNRAKQWKKDLLSAWRWMLHVAKGDLQHVSQGLRTLVLTEHHSSVLFPALNATMLLSWLFIYVKQAASACSWMSNTSNKTRDTGCLIGN